MSTNGSCFIQGKAGEKYVRRNLNNLLQHGIVAKGIDTADDHVEGGDNRVVYCKFGEEVDMADFDLDGAVGIHGTGRKISETLIGGLEVKTICNFTFRNNDNNEPTGTLPFELWNENKYGWLLALLNPEQRLKEDEIHAVQPVLFCFLLVSYLGPYACVMFEDFPELAQRLKELASEKGFQLVPVSEESPQGIPTAEKADTWREADPYVIDTCWHVPFERLSDLATVTLIGDKPLVKSSTRLMATDQYEQLQDDRYSYLRKCAENRAIIPSEAQSEEDFYPADITHIYADILQNMRIIEQLKQEDYPYLFQALESLGMRTHLNSILFNMYSQENPTIINDVFVCFLQGKGYLRDWCRERKIKGSPFSWQSHIIFLTDTDLFKKYVDNSIPTRQKVYRSVPRYTEEVLHTADQKAKAYIDAGIKLTNFTKAEVIKVSGQARADQLYYGDGRTISKMQDEVDQEFLRIANQLLDEKGLVSPDEVCSAVSSVIIGKYIIPFEIENDPEQERKYKQACNELHRLKNRYAELAVLVPCQYRGLKKEEKIKLGLSIHSRKKYYVR